MSSGTFNWTGGTLLVNGTATANLSIPELGELSGSGTIIGDITSAGTISPGNSPGILTIDGNYVVADGLVTFDAGEAALSVRIDASAEGQLEALKGAIERHLDRFAFREAPLRVDWQ